MNMRTLRGLLPAAESEREEPGTGSLRRALEVVGLVSDRPGMALPEIALALGVHKSTAYRLCTTLVQAGFLEQDSERGGRTRYRLGLWLFVLGSRAAATQDVKHHAPQVMRRLAEQTGLPAYLTLVWKGVTICIEEIPGPAGSVWLGSSVGVPHPVHATASGKLFLADLPEADARDLLTDMDLRPLGPNTRTTPEAVLADLEQVRAAGYALNDEETEYGVRYLGVPIRDPQGRFLAGLTVGATVEQHSREGLIALVPPLRAAAAALEARLERMPAPLRFVRGTGAPGR